MQRKVCETESISIQIFTLFLMNMHIIYVEVSPKTLKLEFKPSCLAGPNYAVLILWCIQRRTEHLNKKSSRWCWNAQKDHLSMTASLCTGYFCSGWPHLQHCSQIWDPQHETDKDLLEWAQRKRYRCSKGWSTSAMETCWESLGYSAWRREGSEENLLWLFST